MSTTGAILLAFLAFLVGYFSRRPVPLNQGRHLESIKRRIDNLEQVLERLDERTYELTLSPFEQNQLQDKRRFDSEAVRGAAFAVPAGLGVQEGTFMVTGALVGLPPEVSLSLSLASRVREIVPSIPGLVAWQVSEGRALLQGTPSDPTLSGTRQ